jgi:hypothetical protein
MKCQEPYIEEKMVKDESADAYAVLDGWIGWIMLLVFSIAFTWLFAWMAYNVEHVEDSMCYVKKVRVLIETPNQERKWHETNAACDY